MSEKFNGLNLWMKDRINKNKNVIIVINGGTGSGKTYAALRLAYDMAQELDTNFSVEGNVDFNFKALLEKMERPENDKPGTPFIFEEVGAIGGGASAHQWQTKANQFFNSFLQTDRHKRRILIMTTPSFSYLDNKSRQLCHMQITMKGINHRNKESYLSPYYIQVNDRSGKMYFKFLRFRIDGVRYKYNRHICKIPPEEIIKPYEKIKGEYTTNLRKSIMEYEEAAKEAVKHPKETVNERYERFKSLLPENLSVKETAARLGVHERTVKSYRAKFRKESLENPTFEGGGGL